MRIRFPGLAIHLAAAGWTGTWRLSRLHEEHAEAARAAGPQGAVVGAFYHQSLLLAAATHHHRRVAALVSRSADGELITAHLARIGILSVRGSSHRGGTQAARELMRAIEDGWMVATSIDGPRGPAFRAKPGMVELARRQRLPLVPMGFGASRWWEMPTWDRFRLPWPGARVCCAYGEPITYPPEQPDHAELTRRCADIDARIAALERAAMAAVGRRR